MKRLAIGSSHRDAPPTGDKLNIENGSLSTPHAQHKPRRKFAPQPVETSSRSSRTDGLQRDNVPNGSQEGQQASKPPAVRRKFLVSPVETSARSSKNTSKDDKSKQTPPAESVEAFSRPSRDADQQKQPTKPKRKFAPQMVETSAMSSRERRTSVDDSPTASRQSSTSSRRFAPELVETAKGSFRKKPSPSPSAIPAYLRDEMDMQEGDEAEASTGTGESRFSAANIAKRSKKDPRRHSYCIPDLPVIQSDSSGEESARSLSSSPDVPNMYHQHEHRRRPHPKIQPESPSPPTQFHVDDRTLRDQAIAAYVHAEAHVPFNHYGGDSDDEDDRRSLTGKFTTDATSRPSMFRRASDVDLHLAQADMRLHRIAFERAKAEYEEDTAGASRFSSTAIAARHRLGIHHPEGTTLHQRNQVVAQSPSLGTPTKTPAASPTGAVTPDTDAEYRRAREAARPPMLGEELKFPFTVSPRMTRCDVDQPPRPRRVDSEDGSGSREDDGDGNGGVKLWAANVSVNNNATAGLWGGLCQASNTKTTEQPTTPLRSGLQTPAYDHDNPFNALSPPPTSTQIGGIGGGLWGSHTGSKTPAGARTPGRKIQPQPLMPLTPPRTSRDSASASDAFTASLDKKLALETLIEDEFPPRVITQIYNYLSLGYPPLARPFDAELSKISRISISDLRKADRSGSGQVKGYIGTPERDTVDSDMDIEIDPDTGTVRGCRRWEALRLYVKEWARQSPNFASERAFCEGGADPKRRDVGAGQWGGGAGVRKGSWGF